MYQIGVKHYGLRGGRSGSKVPMTPKLYDEVQKRLSAVWGPYAGWAQSVRGFPVLMFIRLNSFFKQGFVHIGFESLF